jgi:hypothetical protein
MNFKTPILSGEGERRILCACGAVVPWSESELRRALRAQYCKLLRWNVSKSQAACLLFKEIALLSLMYFPHQQPHDFITSFLEISGLLSLMIG